MTLAPKTRAAAIKFSSIHEVYGGTILNTETGELYDLKDLPEEYEVLIVPKRKQSRADNYVSRLLEIQANGGKPAPSKDGFVLAMYESMKSIRERFAELNEADLGRLLYLSSFISWVDSKQGRLQFDNGAPIKREHFAALVSMSQRRASEYLERLLAASVLTEKADQFFMSTDVFYYGAVKKKSNAAFDFIRVYKGAVRKIYDEAGTKAAAQLALVYAVLPYINKATNVICINPHETDIDSIEFLPMKELAKLLGYKDSRKLKTAMNKILIGEEVVFCFSENPNNRRQTFITVNPKVIYGGNNDNLPLIESHFNQRNQTILEVA